MSTTNPTLPLFYKKVVPLNKEQHGDLCIEPMDGYQHTRETNSLYIAAIEFPNIAREYPIVFGTEADGNIFPVVLLGLRKNENFYVNDKGEWQADYIPAYVRRYPFILASTEANGGQFTVCIDESFPGFNTAKEGQPLFDKAGEQTDLLKQSVDFLKDYQNHVQLTTLFCDNLKKLDLLEPMQANIALKSGEKQTMGGFLGVSRERVKELKPAKLAELVKSDQLELIYAHLGSLANLSVLMNRLN